MFKGEFCRVLIIGCLVVLFSSCDDKGSKLTPKDNVVTETLVGQIDEGYNYAIKVEYLASNDHKKCKDWALFAGESARRVSRYYLPEIKDGRHTITFPRNELSSYSRCQWIPTFAHICVGNAANPTHNYCSELFELTHYFSKHSKVDASAVADRKQPLLTVCAPFESHKEFEGIRLWCQRADKTNSTTQGKTAFPDFPLKLVQTSREEVTLNIQVRGVD